MVLGRGREKMKHCLGSISHAVMHRTVNWSWQEDQLELGLCWLKAMGDSAPMYEPCGPPLPLGSLGAPFRLKVPLCRGSNGAGHPVGPREE